MPLLRDVDQLLLDKGIARLFGALFALQRLGAVLIGLLVATVVSVCAPRDEGSPRRVVPAN